MTDAHILDGDIILVRRQEAVSRGEVAIVLIDEALMTVKRFYRERDGRVRLQPASDEHEPQYYAPERVRVQGKVVGVYRVIG